MCPNRDNINFLLFIIQDNDVDFHVEYVPGPYSLLASNLVILIVYSVSAHFIPLSF